MALTPDERIAQYKKEVDDFAYIVSHDISAPIRTIISYTDLLERKLNDKLDDTDKEYFENIQRGKKKYMSMMQEINKYGKLSTNFTPSEDLTDTRKLLDNAIHSLGSRIDSSKTKISITGNFPSLHIDENQIQFIFWEFIDNAIKYAKSETKPIIGISCTENDKEHLFSFKDNGIGIQDKFFDKIFQIFRKLHHEKHYAGAGIGLTYAKKIADTHGGSISVESTEDAGATFTLHLPKQQKARDL